MFSARSPSSLPSVFVSVSLIAFVSSGDEPKRRFSLVRASPGVRLNSSLSLPPPTTLQQVENFVRKGPRWSDGPRFLFTLKLEDDHGVVEAVAAGPDASRLLPGSPSPRAFLESHDARARTERVLARIEAAADAGEEGGRVALRLRSYLAPLVEVGRRGEKCKRYSIIAPSCLEEDGAEGLDAQGKG